MLKFGIIVHENYFEIELLKLGFLLANQTSLPSYLLEKQGELAEINLKFIVIWADQWLHNKAIIKGRLQSLIGEKERIMARKCIVQRINKNLASEFLTKNHLMGYINSKLKYGLFY